MRGWSHSGKFVPVGETESKSSWGETANHLVDLCASLSRLFLCRRNGSLEALNVPKQGFSNILRDEVKAQQSTTPTHTIRSP